MKVMLLVLALALSGCAGAFLAFLMAQAIALLSKPGLPLQQGGRQAEGRGNPTTEGAEQ